MGEEFESERTITRNKTASILRQVADGVTDGNIQLRSGENEVSVQIPDEIDLEIEVETGEKKRSLEIELEWPIEKSS